MGSIVVVVTSVVVVGGGVMTTVARGWATVVGVAVVVVGLGDFGVDARVMMASVVASDIAMIVNDLLMLKVTP
jgi:hypothetical protein